MDKNGFKHYRKGIKQSRNVFSRNIAVYFKYWIFLLTSIISKATIVLSPLSILGHFNIVEELEENNDITLEKVTKDLNNKTKYQNTLLLYVIKVLVLLAGLLIIGIISTTLGYIGYLIDLTSDLRLYLFTTLFSIPGGIVALLYLLRIHTLFEMASLIAKEDDKLTVSEIIAKSNKLINKRTIFKLFVVYFINLLIVLIVLSGLTYLFFLIERGYDIISAIIILIVLSIGFLMFLTNRLLAIKISTFNLLNSLLEKENQLYAFSSETDELKEKEKALIALFETGGL